MRRGSVLDKACAVLLAGVVVAACSGQVTGSAGSGESTEHGGGAGMFGPGDGSASGLLDVSIAPAAATVCPGGCVSLSAKATGADGPFAIAWSGVEGSSSTVRVCPAATTTYAVTMTSGAEGRGEGLAQEPAGSARATVTVSPTCGADGGTDGAAPAVDAGTAGHETCSQSLAVGNAGSGTGQGGLTRILAIDGAGDVIVAVNFIGTANVAGRVLQSGGDAGLLVVKLDPACRVLWAKAFGAPQADVELVGVAADAAGNVVVVGDLTGAAVDFGSGSVAPGSGSLWGAFVFKLGPDGAGLWSHGYRAPVGSNTQVSMIDVAVDPSGNPVFVASTQPPGQSTAVPGVDFGGGGVVAYARSLIELDANGQFVFAANASPSGPIGPFEPYTLTTDSTGRILAAGYEPGSQLDIVAFDTGGRQQWLQSVSTDGSGASWEPMVAVDANNEIFTVESSGMTLPDGSWGDAVTLFKRSASGAPSWASAAIVDPPSGWTFIDGRLAVDPSGTALLTSTFAGSADFGAGGTLTSAGGVDAAVLRFDAQGHLLGAIRWGGPDDDVPYNVAVDPAGDTVIAGWSSPPSSAGNGGSGNGSTRLFVAKLNP
ncbi:MAG TPA: hypothetical protein VHV30_12640 [Polyangiaceae bacterium]|nr:hypothetical protein [Polyangiaceae bacterium]